MLQPRGQPETIEQRVGRPGTVIDGMEPKEAGNSDGLGRPRLLKRDANGLSGLNSSRRGIEGRLSEGGLGQKA
jgi:hypothetical protein